MIMSPEHPKWEQFCNELAFQIDRYGCNANDKPHAECVLKEFFPKVDIPKTFEFFEQKGGFCDCEILMNVDNTAGVNRNAAN